MKQSPKPGDFILKWRGDFITVTLDLPFPRKGRAAFRTNLGNAHIRRSEIIAETERGETPMARAWTDIPLEEIRPGLYSADIPLDEVGIFSGKACFFPEGSSVPEWPEGANTHIKVASDLASKSNSIYTVFPRQFGSFREVARRLPHIMDTMGFRIVQTLPPFPVPVTYAVMGEYGCPFASLDFFSVDPAMAEFDEYSTPLDQFCELVDAVHSRKGLFFVDLPANHTGWASALQTHHPEWFNREEDGRFVSPGAWGVKWADLVELDYSNAELRAYMADVFLFWCRKGVDGFRCDAGYMIPAETWQYIVCRVREEYPDTLFMLEGLGGDLSVTDSLLADSGLDWAYSEIFQTYDRSAFEWYFPGAIARSEKYGALVHFAETHDNDRLAKGGSVYAALRVQLAALLSWQGAWGIANGVEWLCTEKIDVHGRNDLNWGAADNIVPLISKLNFILDTNPTFTRSCHLEVITSGGGNTLAVLRTSQYGRVLVLANLDCASESKIEWDLCKFSQGEVFDLMAEKRFSLGESLRLAPGEVRVFAASPGKVANSPVHAEEEKKSHFHWAFPRDVKREVVVPSGVLFEISAPHHFRFHLVDPVNGKTLCAGISAVSCARNIATLLAPHYEGGGFSCRALLLKMVVYAPGRAIRTVSKVLIPPPATSAKVKLQLDADEVRRNSSFRTILSNGAGAASQMRIGWGEIASQYDAILAANPNASCPSDRLNIWTRTRCWLQREGYTREFDRKSTVNFAADPAGRSARWDFVVPCGMGKTASFSFEIALADGFNAARLKVVRNRGGADDVGDQVRIVFRPDIEWRSFHAASKAFAGLEELFSKSVAISPRGFSFAPYEGSFKMEIEGGEYHHEPQWSYNVGHPEEAERGQEPSGDLFSPGWISADLKVGEAVTLVGEAKDLGAVRPEGVALEFAEMPAHAPREASVPEALEKGLDLYIVKRDDLKTVIAGYPWFLDWGRDTFIFMRGMIAAGKLDDSLAILKAFASFEENGTLPNIIYGKTAGNRDTTDAQLWFIRCVMEMELAGVDVASLRSTCESIVDNYIKGTPNGIKVDPQSALVYSPSHFTWMDTNYPACTPREGYPVEIQALWISALKYLGRTELSGKALESVKKYFKRPNGGYFDCLAASAGQSAERAVPENTIRPNELFLITLGVVRDPAILAETEELLIPGGVRSLEAANLLYKGVYSGDEDTMRKPAYHNGTVWGWPFALYSEALAILRPEMKQQALALLASAVENINSGCIAQMSENADGDAPHRQKGCTAQAWSVSELLRVWLKLG
ncbi:MAG: glycogen debranching enzyme N-terminal domain-containing protein [Kiritimatiellae bacterium]|nr:glycogen debranching enzyme N-terminal domain-containing protein [Kiritimatiellia bacterium]